MSGMHVVVAILTMFSAEGKPTESRTFQMESWEACVAKPVVSMVEGQRAIMSCGVLDLDKLNLKWEHVMPEVGSPA